MGVTAALDFATVLKALRFNSAIREKFFLCLYLNGGLIVLVHLMFFSLILPLIDAILPAEVSGTTSKVISSSKSSIYVLYYILWFIPVSSLSIVINSSYVSSITAE